MAPLDSSVVNVAMPTLAEVFNTSVSTVSWVSMTYLLVLSSLMLTYGRLGDMLGYKKLLRGNVDFTISSLLCGLFSKYSAFNFCEGNSGIGWRADDGCSSGYTDKRLSIRREGKGTRLNAAMAVAFGLALVPAWRLLYTISVDIYFILISHRNSGYFLAKKVIPPDREIKPKI